MSAQGPATRLTIRGVRTTAVEVPMTFALGTSAAIIRAAPLLLIELDTDEGVTGRTYLFCYRRSGARAIADLLHDAVELVKGERAAPVDVGALLSRRFALIGVTGVARMALSGLDAALWDAAAMAAGVPLARLLGAEPKPIPVYNSNGLGLMAPEAAADEAQKLCEGGFGAVKLRLGYATLDDDLAAARAVRRALPDGVALMADYNQALSRAEALRRGRALDDEGLYWVEEPIRHDDYAGHAALTDELTLPIQIGENFNGPDAMAQALAVQACDLVMPDLARIGGVTGWMQAAGVAAAHGIPMSSHLFPEVSCHLLAASPTRHWLEYVDWANAIIEEPLRIENGQAAVADRPGSGLTWNDKAVQRYALA
ncbi:MAG TPA: enolase C-terminal domain-like protein [Beijerinckiaceae bacterium]|nr:enolase C-terminal domain-like protein [Beijerinckiaceae bacterium]